MPIQNRTIKRNSGFSLIEAMIAVLVLAVGLLALVALQSNLVREGADAKARSRIASLVSSRMDEARAAGYTAIPATIAAAGCSAGNDICVAEEDAAVSGLELEGLAPSTSGANSSEFKTLTMSARWTDAAGKDRSLEMSTIISPLSLDTTSTLLNQQLAGDVSKKPIVRTADPATDGVVPIALGNGSASAASNPTPELVGQQNNQEVVGTRFTVLTYVPSGSASVIQKRIETTVIKCTCEYAAGGTNLPEIYQNAEWPAIWTGERYDVFEPSPAAPAPGQSLSSGPKAGVQQSPLCQECCRDHHDDSATGVAKFDPERTDGSTSKYKIVDNNGVKQLTILPNASGTYVDACRVIRVDGMWRTAADMYSRQLGLLETESVSNVKAKTGLPTTSATTAYTTFVKNYLKQYDGSTGAAPTNAFTLFDATPGLNEPVTVPIAAPSTTDYRYLHARGLYVDYLEAAARKKLADVLADTGERGLCPQATKTSAIEDCVMPYLPFTSANLTEIATWTAIGASGVEDTTVLGVNSGNVLATNPSQPSGGRSYGKKAGTAENTVVARISNSGMAVNTAQADLGGIDLSDASAVATDGQPFEVGGDPGTSTGGEFFVTIGGGGANPFAHYIIGTDTGECVKQSDGSRPCTTNSTLPMAGSVRLENYWRETTTKREPDSNCDSGGGTMVPVKGNQDVPTFTNYAVTGATNGGTIAAPVNNGKATETTTISFGSISAGATVALTLTVEGTVQYATPTTCTVTNVNSGATTVTGWLKPWEQP